jgi:hypothetical protein
LTRVRIETAAGDITVAVEVEGDQPRQELLRRAFTAAVAATLEENDPALERLPVPFDQEATAPRGMPPVKPEGRPGKATWE